MNVREKGGTTNGYVLGSTSVISCRVLKLNSISNTVNLTDLKKIYCTYCTVHGPGGGRMSG